MAFLKGLLGFLGHIFSKSLKQYQCVVCFFLVMMFSMVGLSGFVFNTLGLTVWTFFLFFLGFLKLFEAGKSGADLVITSHWRRHQVLFLVEKGGRWFVGRSVW